MNIRRSEEALRGAAQVRARDFLENSRDWRLGDIEAEQSHPLTRDMSDVFARSVEDGAALLAACDAQLIDKVQGSLQSDTFARMETQIREALLAGGRVILSGCGSSGRLCMRAESSFRKAARAMGGAALAYEDRVLALMTGGDYAVIRSVEYFEDFAELGRCQAAEFQLGARDLLIGVTATGETTSILGTAARALDDGASVWMLVCSQPDRFFDRLARAATVYRRPRTEVFYLPSGPMALTGSTRMQSSTFEQAILCVALERALVSAAHGTPRPVSFYADAFARVVRRIAAPDSIRLVAEQIRLEEQCYRNGGLITYFADDCLLDTLTDTTERSPTFMTPPFAPDGTAGRKPSWAFVKNPSHDTRESWTRCFNRAPRCIEWSRARYADMGLTPEVIDRIPPIGQDALCRFRVGCEPDAFREENPESVAVWIGVEEAPPAFFEQAKRYRHSASFTLADAGVQPDKTSMDIFEHLAMKMLLNDFSTGTMVRMGRVHGNWMTFLDISNKKLVDRGARIVAQLCGLSYEAAMEALFFTQETLDDAGVTGVSATQETIRRLLAKSC